MYQLKTCVNIQNTLQWDSRDGAANSQSMMLSLFLDDV